MVLLSIIIATKDRAEYCFESVKSILNCIKVDFEIVIQDNSANDKLDKMIRELNVETVKYNNTKEPLSIIGNFNAAIALSTGKFLCILGDDDTVLPNILDTTRWMECNNIDSLCSTAIIDYTWPNSALPKPNNGILRLPTYTGYNKRIDLQKAQIGLLQAGIISYQNFLLPRIYHGLVKRSCLEEVKEKTGHYFGGLTPDIYATITLSCAVYKHFVIDYPFTVAGACPASASVASKLGRHAGVLSSAPHFKFRGEYVWDSCIPEYYSVETIWAETALKAFKEIGMSDMLIYFNLYEFLIESIYANKSSIFKLSLSKTLVLKKSGSSIQKILFVTKLLYAFLRITIRKFFARIDRFFFKKVYAHITTIEDVATLEKAIDISMLHIKEINFTYD